MVTSCAIVPLNSIILPVDVDDSVMVPPDWLKVPATFTVPLELLDDKSTVPALWVNVPVTFNIPVLPAPMIVVPEEECVKFPVTFTVPVPEAMSQFAAPETTRLPPTVSVAVETHRNFPVLVPETVRDP